MRDCTGVNSLSLPKEKDIAGTTCPVALLHVSCLGLVIWTSGLCLALCPMEFKPLGLLPCQELLLWLLPSFGDWDWSSCQPFRASSGTHRGCVGFGYSRTTRDCILGLGKLNKDFQPTTVCACLSGAAQYSAQTRVSNLETSYYCHRSSNLDVLSVY